VAGLIGFGLVAAFLSSVLDLSGTTAALVSLAVLTPSAGFILESLDGMRGSESEKFWIRSTVIAAEVAALGVMFFTLQSNDPLQLLQSGLILLLMVLALPRVFQAFATWIAPFAPKSEFAFLIVVAICCAFMTKALGVYYLVGAFVVGMAAQRFRKELPAMASEKMLESVEAFASLFVPFYFFKAGSALRLSDLSLDALLTGVALVAIAIPVRIGAVAAHRRLAAKENWETGMRLSVAMLPTLVFTLVMAQILRSEPRFELPGYLFGALIVYAMLSTVIPTFLLREEPAEATDTSERQAETAVDRALPGSRRLSAPLPAPPPALPAAGPDQVTGSPRATTEPRPALPVREEDAAA
jgi:Kef-type K+ transport system membrane component KefB